MQFLNNFFEIVIYNFIKKFFSQKNRNSLKKRLTRIKNKLGKLDLLIYGTINDDELFIHLNEKLGKEYEILMVHCSYDSMKPMYIGNLNLLLKKLISYCSLNNITLVMPAFFFGKGGNDLSDAAEYYAKHPSINLKRTVSQMGLLSEIFRRFPGTKRSIHPTHSVIAVGPLSEKITKTHHLSDNPYGEGTPFGIMAQHNTKILGIGTKYFRVLTQVHTAEELLKEKFPINFTYDKTIPITCISQDDESINYLFRVRKREYRIDALRLRKFLKDIKIESWKYNGIPFFLTEAKLVTNILIQNAKKGKTIYKKI